MINLLNDLPAHADAGIFTEVLFAKGRAYRAHCLDCVNIRHRISSIVRKRTNRVLILAGSAGVRQLRQLSCRMPKRHIASRRKSRWVQSLTTATQKPFSYSDECVGRNPHVAYSPISTQASNEAVKALLKSVFKLN